MSNGEVQATVGANITPFMRSMAEVKASAKETGEAIGVELGDKGGRREEMRLQRGLDGFLKSLSNAKDPVSALGGAVEGLSTAFAASGVALLAIGIGTAVYEQFSKASEASKKLETDIGNLGHVNPDNESVRQLQQNIDDFQKVEDEYKERGLLERVLFGPEEDRLFKEASALTEIKKNLLEIKQIQEEDTRAHARQLQASTNPQDQQRGRQLLKSLSDDHEKSDLQDKLAAAEKEHDAAQKKLDQQESLIAGAREAAKHGSRRTNTLAVASEGHDENVAAVKSAQDRIDAIKKAQADLASAQQAENDKDSREAGEKASKEEADRIKEAVAKQNEIKSEAAMEGMSGEQKAAALRNQIRVRTEDQDIVGPRQQSKVLSDQNEILELQLALKKQIAENDRESATKAAEATRKAQEQAERLTELKNRRADLLTQQAQAKSDATTATVEAMGFHGQVSSLRRVGFGSAPTGGHAAAQLKAAQEANNRLQKISQEITTLNQKIGGSA